LSSIGNKKKRIGILINNSGYGRFGELEVSSFNEIREQFETNYFGAIKVMKQVIPTNGPIMPSKYSIGINMIVL
jgi:short-subunit dehydrogenase